MASGTQVQHGPPTVTLDREHGVRLAELAAESVTSTLITAPARRARCTDGAFRTDGYRPSIPAGDGTGSAADSVPGVPSLKAGGAGHGNDLVSRELNAQGDELQVGGRALGPGGQAHGDHECSVVAGFHQSRSGRGGLPRDSWVGAAVE